MNITTLITIVIITICLLATTAFFLYKFITNLKEKNLTLKDLNLLTMVPTFIKEAEKFINYSGQEKLKYVITRLNEYAIKNGIPFDEHKVISQVEELISLTKSVNIK